MKYCSKCGNELVDEAYVCPKCGCKVGSGSNSQKTNGMAIAGFVCAFLIPLLGWIFGGIGLKRARNEWNGNGKGLSIAAIIIASVIFVINFLLLI